MKPQDDNPMQTPDQTNPKPLASLSERSKTLIWVAVIGVIGNITVSLLAAMYGKEAVDRRAKEAKASVGNVLVPVGTIVAYGGDIDEERRKELDNSGWLLCDGRPVPRGPQYAELAKLLGRIWGPGNNADGFNTPNLQGMFLRGIDLNGKNDPDFQTRTNWSGQGRKTFLNARLPQRCEKSQAPHLDQNAACSAGQNRPSVEIFVLRVLADRTALAARLR